MPRVSRRSVKKDVADELQEHFASLIASLQRTKEIEQFFKDFLTQEEKTMLMKRLMLHLMLENGYQTSQIEAVLSVSRETIRIHKSIWSNGGETYRNIIDKIARRQKTKLLWKKIEKILTPIDLMLRAKSDIKARAKLLSGDY